MIYLDHNATTPVAPSVLETMLPYFSEKYGNASSITHAYGWKARDGVDTALDQICGLLHCDKKEIVFTSGATESINMALKGVFEIYRRKGNHIITTVAEHKAVLDTCKRLEKQGARISYLGVDSDGLVDPDELRKEISDSTILVSVIYGNNETGVLQPMTEIADIVHGHRSILMSDATQVVGKLPVNMQTDRIDLLAFSGHKFYAPKGVGALYVRRKKPRVILSPLIDGGGHQNGLRSGTLNVPGIVGLGAAASLAMDEMAENATRIGLLRTRLEDGMKKIAGFHLNGSPDKRLYNTSNFYFEGVKAEDIIRAVKTQLAIATGSACTSEDQQPSHVLIAMGRSETAAYASVRLSLGRDTTQSDIDETIALLQSGIAELRANRL